MFTLDISDAMQGKYLLEITNLQGAVVVQSELSPLNNRHQLNLSGLAKGMYLIKVKDDSKQIVQKLLIY